MTKQSNMFHKFNLNDFNDDDNVETDDENDNPVAPIIAAIQNQRAKKIARLPKNNISDPM